MPRPRQVIQTSSMGSPNPLTDIFLDLGNPATNVPEFAQFNAIIRSPRILKNLFKFGPKSAGRTFLSSLGEGVEQAWSWTKGISPFLTASIIPQIVSMAKRHAHRNQIANRLAQGAIGTTGLIGHFLKKNKVTKSLGNYLKEQSKKELEYIRPGNIKGQNILESRQPNVLEKMLNIFKHNKMITNSDFTKNIEKNLKELEYKNLRKNYPISKQLQYLQY
ncbi:MAG: hypothetical protein D6813_01410 [Calditrichaeota bacterium]|nr:MAG: hypothetical protein D6813_01410 [Calditrichota bacterium]